MRIIQPVINAHKAFVVERVARSLLLYGAPNFGASWRRLLYRHKGKQGLSDWIKYRGTDDILLRSAGKSSQFCFHRCRRFCEVSHALQWSRCEDGGRRDAHGRVLNQRLIRSKKESSVA